MSDTLGRRIFLSHLELSYRLGRKVTLADFGAMIARHLGRETPFTAAAVSRWEAGEQVPSLVVIEAIAVLTHLDPGWISHGNRSGAPRPRRLPTPARNAAVTVELQERAAPRVVRKRATAPRRRSR